MLPCPCLHTQVRLALIGQEIACTRVFTSVLTHYVRPNARESKGKPLVLLFAGEAVFRSLE